jgi:hypothetical protein
MPRRRDVGDAIGAVPWPGVLRYNCEMIAPITVVLESRGIRLEPLGPEHHDGLVAAAADGELWKLWFTSVPDAAGTPAYVANALKGQAEGHMLP